MKKIVAKLKKLVNKRKKLLIFAAIVIIILTFIGQRTIFKGQGQPQYQIAKVERSTLVSTVSASGQVSATGAVALTTQASGIVSDVYVVDGSIVNSGDKIAKINLDQQGLVKQAQAWASYLSAKNTLDAVNATSFTLRSKKDTAWKKFYDLATNSTYQNGDGTPREDQRSSSSEFQSLQADWLAAEANYKNQEGVINQASAALNSAWLSYQQVSDIVFAPFSGVIEGLGIQVGSSLASSSSSTSLNQNYVAAIISQEIPIISVNLSEVDAPKVEIGNKATITFDALPGKTFMGEVVAVNIQGVVTSGVTTYPATITMETSSPEILNNMSSTADIVTYKKENVLLVPNAAVVTQEGRSFVRVLRNGRVRLVQVEVGASSDTQTEIISGISEGDEVVTGTVASGTGSGSTSPFGVRPFGGGGLAPGGRVQTQR